MKFCVRFHISLLYTLLMVIAATEVRASPITESLVIGGDGGRLDPRMSKILKEWLQKSADKRSLIYLGDNVYPRGVPDKKSVEDYERAKAIILLQMNPAKETNSNFLFVPGNHDWDDSSEGGFRAIKRQEELIEELSEEKTHFYPKNACPGPTAIKFTDNMQMIIFDTQWWLHEGPKPSLKSDGCAAISREELKTEFKKIADGTGADILNVFVSHHPLKSHGKNAFSPNCPQGGRCPKQLEMKKALNEFLSPFKNLICVGGHDHGLQVIKAENEDVCGLYIISGAISDTTDILPQKGAIFSSLQRGFLKVDLKSDGTYHLSGITVDFPDQLQFRSEEIFSATFTLGPKHIKLN